MTDRANWYLTYPARDTKRLWKSLTTAADERSPTDRDRIAAAVVFAAAVAAAWAGWTVGAWDVLWPVGASGFAGYVYLTTRESWDDHQQWIVSREIATIAADEILLRSDPRWLVWVEDVHFGDRGQLMRWRLCYPDAWDDHVAKNREDLIAKLEAKLGFRIDAEWNIPNDYVDCRRAQGKPRSALETGGKVAWPLVDADHVDIWKPVPVGFDDRYRPVVETLVKLHWLLGGESGAGKSVQQTQMLAAFALSADVDLVLFDGNHTELRRWAPLADTFVSITADNRVDVAGATRVLRNLNAEMNRRMLVLGKDGHRELTRAAQRKHRMRFIVVVVDELAEFTEGKQGDEFEAELRSILRRGRKFGINVVDATQKPHGDVIDTNVRDLHQRRWAGRCMTWQSSDTILGSGMAKAKGCDASDIGPSQVGVGWLRGSGDPVLVKSYWITERQIDAIVDRGLRLRDVDPSAARAAVADAERIILTGNTDDDDGDDGDGGGAVVRPSA